ncbi:MAG: site-2 protease family protein [Phycisphaerae bacterium]
MFEFQNGSVRIARAFRIDVFIHWTWGLIVLWMLMNPWAQFTRPIWNLAVILGLFGIVTLHEFGHSLAAISVGGKPGNIVLWPFGGIAFTNAPNRPGASLWVVAAGPLVNVILYPLFYAAYHYAKHAATAGSPAISSDEVMFLLLMFEINKLLLLFNILPSYPLDGGQILRSLLWFVVGEAKSLRMAAALGMAGAVGIGLWFLIRWHSIYMLFLCLFLLQAAWSAYQVAGMMPNSRPVRRRQGATRSSHDLAACPNCGNAPPRGEFHTCGACQASFDVFAGRGRCPRCGADFTDSPITCPSCNFTAPLRAWFGEAAARPPT